MSGAAFEKNATIDPFFSYIGRNYRSEAITTVINVAQSWSIYSRVFQKRSYRSKL